MNRFLNWVNQLNKKRMNNKGASLIIVIIAMAMIGILAVTILWTSYINYMIKINDKNNKDNFYAAEVVMEQVMAGLQNEAYYAAGLAYKDVMTNWNENDGEGSKHAIFNQKYKDVIKKDLLEYGATDVYDREKLLSFTDASPLTVTSPIGDVSYPIDLPIGSGTQTFYISAGYWNGDWDEDGNPEKNPLIFGNATDDTNYISVKNIGVKVCDRDGYVSIITTDVNLEIPNVTFTKADEAFGLYDFCLIGGQGVTVEGTNSVVGSIYAGDRYLEEDPLAPSATPTPTSIIPSGGLYVESGHSLTVKDAKWLIAGKDITLSTKSGGSATLNIVPSTLISKVYSQNIVLNGTGSTLNAVPSAAPSSSPAVRMLISDDLTINGKQNKATVVGEYQGYGYEQDVDNHVGSSAIVVNGVNSTVDFTGVDKLLLGGRAYISGETSQVMMGETIATKGNQIAYLVPAEAIGTLNHETVLGVNPVTEANLVKLNELKEKYKDDENDEFLEVDISKKITSLNGKSLSDFGVTSDTTDIKKIKGYSNGVVSYYYYVSLGKAQAAQYFVDYYSNHKSLMDNFYGKYANDIALKPGFNLDDSYTILGNAMVGAKTAPVLYSEQTVTPEAPNPSATPVPEDELIPGAGANPTKETNVTDDTDDIDSNYSAKYRNLLHTLSESRSAAGNVVSNISRLDDDTTSTDTIRGFVNEYGTSGIAVFADPADEYCAVFTNRQFNVTGDTYSFGGKTYKLRLVVCVRPTADAEPPYVNVNANTHALVISEGKVFLQAGAQIEKDKVGLKKALDGKCPSAQTPPSGKEADKDKTALYFFGGDISKTIDEGIDWSSVVYYTNWFKK